MAVTSSATFPLSMPVTVSRRLTGMPTARLADRSRMRRSPPEHGRLPLARAVVAAFQSMAATGVGDSIYVREFPRRRLTSAAERDSCGNPSVPRSTGTGGGLACAIADRVGGEPTYSELLCCGRVAKVARPLRVRNYAIAAAHDRPHLPHRCRQDSTNYANGSPPGSAGSAARGPLPAHARRLALAGSGPP
jgi:hypothetical protein